MSIAVIQHEFNFSIQFIIIIIIHQLNYLKRLDTIITLLFYIFYKTTTKIRYIFQ